MPRGEVTHRERPNEERRRKLELWGKFLGQGKGRDGREVRRDPA